MKTLKLSKGIKVALATLLMIAIAMIVVTMLSNNQIMASDLAPDCPNCLTSEYMKCVKNNKEEHTWICENEDCDYSVQEKHVDGSHENQGRCQACGYQYQEHKMAEEPKYFIDQSDDMKTYHWKYYPCICEGCNYQYGTTREAHSGGEQCESEGKCQYCDIAYVKHGRAEKVEYYVAANEIHIPVYRCLVEECETIFLAEDEAEKHSLVYKNSVPNEDGTAHSEVYACSVEGCNYEEKSFETPHVFSEKYVDDGDGYHSNVCSECKANVKELHVYTPGQYTDNGDGTHSSKCEQCDYELKENHELKTVNNGNGTHTSSCKNCDYEVTENHNLSEYIDNEDGTHSRICFDLCGYEIKENHTEETIPAVSATCTEPGKTEGKKCSACGVILKAQEDVPALGHSFTNYVSNNDATCENDGTKTAKCDNCEETDTIIEEGTKTTHNFVDGECTHCGQKEVQEEVAIEINSSKYEIGESLISNVKVGTTVEQLKLNIETNATEIKIYNANNEVVSEDEKLATGMKIELKSGEETKTFTIVVRGDVNGDGEAEFKDVAKINQVRLNRATLEEMYSMAADVTDDGIIDFKDLVKINRFRLNKSTEL